MVRTLGYHLVKSAYGLWLPGETGDSHLYLGEKKGISPIMRRVGSRMLDLPRSSIRSGTGPAASRREKWYPEKGTAEVSGEFSAHPPVLWDRTGRLRDAKNPTPGPYEGLRNTRGSRVLHHYLYDGNRLAQRETYRDLPRDASPSEVTRFVASVPGGPTFFADSDRTVDVRLSDRFGRSMFTYRARVNWFSDSWPARRVKREPPMRPRLPG